MNFKDLLERNIENEMPFLRKISIDSQTVDKSDFIANQLLPYLFFTNTIDQNYRIIPIFLRRNEDIIHLPLFFSLALFKIYSDRFLSFKNFESKKYDNENINIRDLNCNVCRLLSVNYTSNDITVQTGKGQIIHRDFANIHGLTNLNKGTGYFKSLEPIFDSIISYLDIIKISGNPLELIRKMGTLEFNGSNHYHGAVFFTQNQSLLKNIDYRDFAINGERFLNTIPSSRLDYKMGNLIFTRLGDNRKTKGQQINHIKEFLVFTHIENYDSYLNIKQEKNWVDTLIFDFTKDIKYLNNVLDMIVQHYSKSLNIGEIKDIYLVFNEKDLYEYRLINDKNILNVPFLLNSEQKRTFLEDKRFSNPTLVESKCIDLSNEFNNGIKAVKLLCAKVHLINLFDLLLKPLFEIKSRYNSFYIKEDFLKKLEALKTESNKIQKDWFYSSEYDSIFRTLYSLFDAIDENINDDKSSLINSLNVCKDASVIIVSYNENKEDQENLRLILGIPNLQFQTPSDLRNPLSDLAKFDFSIILNLNRNLSCICSLNLFPSSVYLILSSSEAKMYNKIKDGHLITKLSNEEKLAMVLNMEMSKDSDDLKKDITPIEDIDPEEFSLNEFIENILKENKYNKIYNSYTRDLLIDTQVLLFKDGTSITVNENKFFFIHKENINSLKDCRVQAKNLVIDDIVFLLNHDSDEFEKLIWQVANDYPEIKNLLQLDKQWRHRIKDFIDNNNISLEHFRELLSENGYSILSSQAIHTWITGDVYQPRNLSELFDALGDLNVIPLDEKESYERSIIAVKKLKTKLPHELQKIYIADLNDLEYNSDYEFPELSKKMYRFMDIKTIGLIIK